MPTTCGAQFWPGWRLGLRLLKSSSTTGAVLTLTLTWTVLVPKPSAAWSWMLAGPEKPGGGGETELAAARGHRGRAVGGADDRPDDGVAVRIFRTEVDAAGDAHVGHEGLGQGRRQLVPRAIAADGAGNGRG